MTVTPSQIADELGRTTPDAPTVAQWQIWIDRAYRLIQARLGAGYASLDPGLVDDVVSEAVAAHVRAWRPTSESRYAVAVDDGREERSYSKDVGAFSISDDLWARLDSAASGGAFTISPSYQPGRVYPCGWSPLWIVP